MIINLTFKEVSQLCKKLESWEHSKAKKFILSMPKASLILDKLDLAMLGLEPDKIYQEMLLIYKNNPRALQLINDAIKNKINYRE